MTLVNFEKKDLAALENELCLNRIASKATKKRWRQNSRFAEKQRNVKMGLKFSS